MLALNAKVSSLESIVASQAAAIKSQNQSIKDLQKMLGVASAVVDDSGHEGEDKVSKRKMSEETGRGESQKKRKIDD